MDNQTVEYFQVDESGNLITDESGEPILFVNPDSYKLSEPILARVIRLLKGMVIKLW
ncbi:hypothetical protein [Nostoc sp. 'Peltigera membranacea cyanobiont' N6]|uniref:hypothetical protein n=1 Tax=Nostoc sp. 'Peltigera membranacea cyanobiont' N6 TaxID=1261031 RepID=UPI0015E3611D|nr:hypothetical protein [Nostoc sp. 'Peltigera membranacea cyanobiont' N6]